MWTTDVAKRAGANPQTLRYYERRGILPPFERSPAGYRNYPESTVSVLRFIKRAQEMGFSLADVDSLLHLADNRADSCVRARAVTADRLADLDRRIADLQRTAATAGRGRRGAVRRRAGAVATQINRSVLAGVHGRRVMTADRVRRRIHRRLRSLRPVLLAHRQPAAVTE